ncbi:MAG: M48 family metalloprotease [Acidobacteria bacterium]|nr:M48 family metalloprotease [Acidobacteriota bacterium]
MSLRLIKHAPLLAVVLFASVLTAQKIRELKPAVSEKQVPTSKDVEIAQQVSAEADRKYAVLRDPVVQPFIDRIVKRISSQPEAGNFPYSIKLVYDPSINAFAYPGGAMYIHHGLLTQADNEEQVAGVLAHEISHVALRHGMAGMLRAQRAQMGAGIAGALASILLGNGAGGQLAQMGLGLAAQSYMLKNSRDAERDADLLGARLMNASGYNPIEMARFFEKLEADGGSRGPAFFSDHPNPGDRIKNVEAEIQALPQQRYDAAREPEFRKVKVTVAGLKAPAARAPGATNPAQTPAPGAQQGAGTLPAPPDGNRLLSYRGRNISMSYPSGWQVLGDRNDPDTATFAPPNGVRESQIGLGLMMAYGPAQGDLRQSTSALIASLRQQNPSMRVGRARSITVDGRPGLAVAITNKSPFGGPERDTVVTTLSGNRLVYVVFIAPESEVPQTQAVFQRMLESIRISQ